MSHEFENLEQFFGTRFNQTRVGLWDEHQTSAEEVLEGYAGAVRSEHLAVLKAEIEQALETHRDEEATSNLLEALHCAYYVPANGWTYRGWLTHVAEVFAEEIARREREAKAGPEVA